MKLGEMNENLNTCHYELVFYKLKKVNHYHSLLIKYLKRVAYLVFLTLETLVFLNSGKDITRNILSSGVYSIPCSCGKFYIGRTHQQFVERFIEHRNSIDNALKFTKPPESFTSALAEHIFFNSDHFVQFEEATAISNDKGFTQWALEALEIKNIFLQVYQLIECCNNLFLVHFRF